MYDIMDTRDRREFVLQCIVYHNAANCDFATNANFVAIGETINQSH